MRTLILLTLALTLAAQPRPIDPPAAPGAGMPFLAHAPDNSLYMSWLEPAGPNRHALRLARLTAGKWSSPETIAEGENWFANWADFASLTVQPDGALYAHWLTRHPAKGKYGYGIRIAHRPANSSQWREIHGMSLDNPSDYAGFLTFLPGAASAVYLAPPTGAAPDEHHDHEGHRKTLRFLQLPSKTDLELDADVCSCCQTAIAQTPQATVIAYRDHLPGEIRDISFVRLANGQWSKPATLHPDNWKINACPTDGPSAAAHQASVAIAWTTRANNAPKVQLALSPNHGQSFQSPLRVDSGNPLGRPTVHALPDGRFAIAWLEKLSLEKVEIRLRVLSRAGALSSPVTIAQAPAGRAAGFPKIAAIDKSNLLVAWREDSVRAVIVSIP